VTGKPHEQCIREVFAGLPEAHLITLVDATSTADNEAVAELGGLMFPGVDAGVRRLSARYRLFIVSNCQSGYIEVFFQTSRLGGCFKDFECWGNTGLSKDTEPARGDRAQPARPSGLRGRHAGRPDGRA
jgi:phosphoglycolate phosphatase